MVGLGLTVFDLVGLGDRRDHDRRCWSGAVVRNLRELAKREPGARRMWSNRPPRHGGSANGVARTRGLQMAYRLASSRRRILPDGRLRDLVDPLDQADLLLRRDLLGDARHELVVGRRSSPAATTKAFGSSPASSSGTPITAQSAIAGWVMQERLELGRRHLEALVLDQLLEPVDDREDSRRRRRRRCRRCAASRRRRSCRAVASVVVEVAASSPAGRGSRARRARRRRRPRRVSGSTRRHSVRGSGRPDRAGLVRSGSVGDRRG